MTQKYDAIVCGGGLAGVFAAVSCAREGLETLLIERCGSLGGAATNMLVNPFMCYSSRKSDGSVIPVNNAGLFLELLGRLEEKCALKNSNVYNDAVMQIVLDEMLEEYDVNVLFHSFVCRVTLCGDAIASVGVVSKSGESEFAAEYFIDATGDADVAFLSGCETAMGREEDGLCQPMTTCFRVEKSPEFADIKTPSEEINALFNRAQAQGKIRNPRENVLKFSHSSPLVVHFNSTRIIGKSAVDAQQLTEAEIEGRKQVWELYCFMRDNIPEYKNSVLLQIAPFTGIRESRRLVGQYVLTADDLISCRAFEDSIARGCYEIDIHNPAGTGTDIRRINGDYYTIPLRSLLPTGLSNLIVAGRPISCDHVAHSAIRVLPIASSVGEAAGCAVAAAAETEGDLRLTDFKRVQQMLDTYGAIY